MKNALVPIDGSPAALRALAFALRAMRNPLDAQVQVLNVHAPLLHPWPGKLVSPDMINAELRSDGEKRLVPAEIMALSASVACVPLVRIGSAATEIIAYAVEHDCDAIVMGARGMGAVGSLVLCCMLDGAFKTDAFGRVVRRKPQRYRGIARICNDTAGTKARF